MTDASEAAGALHAGLVAGGATFAVYLPDSVLFGVEQLLEADPTITTVVCSREDEGVAIAVGAALAGELPVVLMEGTGVGLSGLILARAMLQRTGLLLVFSHVRSRGDAFDYHASARLAGEGICSGLAIPYEVARNEGELADLAEQLLVTARGQKAVVALAVPGSIKV
jgi:sulfopyruvate decarboxylase TPP-binding subunit